MYPPQMPLSESEFPAQIFNSKENTYELLSRPVDTFVGSHHERTAVVLHLDPVLHCGHDGSGGRPEPHLAPRVRSPRLSRYYIPAQLGLSFINKDKLSIKQR